jgi:hypothetical protein
LKQEEITNEVIHYGLWQAVDEVDSNLSILPTKKWKNQSLQSTVVLSKGIILTKTWGI